MVCFDADYYKEKVKNITESDDPVEHFLLVGWRKGCGPNESFDINYYLNRYDNLRESSSNPFMHYLHFGKSKGYFPNQAIEDIFSKLKERKSHEIVSGIDNLEQDYLESRLQKQLNYLYQVTPSVWNYKDQITDLVDWYLENNQKKLALIIWEWFAENNTKTWDVPFLQAAIISRELGLYERSMEILDKALDQYPDNPWIYDNQARCFVQLNQYENATGSWEKAIELSIDKTQKELFSSIKNKHEEEWSQVGATITSTANGKLNGYFSFKNPQQPDSYRMHIYMDDVYLMDHLCNKLKNSNKYVFSVSLPSPAFDGKPHIFSIALQDFPVRYAYYVDVLPVIQTPLQHLRTSILEGNYSSLSGIASYRYESLRKQFDYYLEGSDENMNQQVKNISLAHSVVIEGYVDRKNFRN